MTEYKPAKGGDEFLAKVGKLQESEKAVLRLLIKHNSALGVRTIRDYLVFEAAAEHQTELYQVLSEDGNIQKLLNRIEVHKPIRGDIERLLILYAILPDPEVVASGANPLTFHKKVSILEAAMKKYLKLSFFTWGRIKYALDNLLELGFIEEVPGKLPGREKGKVYGVKPKIFQLWQQRFDYLRDKPKTEAERFWFG